MIDITDMMDIDPRDPWLDTVEPGSTVSAANILMQFGVAGDEQLERVLDELSEMDVQLDLSDLPAGKTMGEAATRLKMEHKLAKDGLSPEKLEENDPLRLYLEELAALPVCGDLPLLVQQKKTMQIMELSLGRVVEIACGFTGCGVLLLDLIQEGSMGLMQAVDTFTGDAQAFEAYRDSRIGFAMAKAVILQAQEFGVGERLRQAMEDYRSTDERLLAELGRNPTLEEMAEALHMTPEEAENVAKILSDVRLLNRAKQPENTDLPQEEEQAVEDTAYFQMRQRIADLLSVLSQQDATIVQMRYGLEGGLPMTAQQVAQRLGMTAQEVQLREAEILKKLRDKKDA